MCPEELVLLVSTLSISIAKDKTPEELLMLASILVQLGDTLVTIATAREQCQDDSMKEQCT